MFINLDKNELEKLRNVDGFRYTAEKALAEYEENTQDVEKAKEALSKFSDKLCDLGYLLANIEENPEAWKYFRQQAEMRIGDLLFMLSLIAQAKD